MHKYTQKVWDCDALGIMPFITVHGFLSSLMLLCIYLAILPCGIQGSGLSTGASMYALLDMCWHVQELGDMFGVGSGTISRYVQIHGLKWPIKYRRCVSPLVLHAAIACKFSLIYEEHLAMAIDAPDKVSHNMLISLAGATLHGQLCVLPHRVELTSAQGAKK